MFTFITVEQKGLIHVTTCVSVHSLNCSNAGMSLDSPPKKHIQTIRYMAYVSKRQLFLYATACVISLALLGVTIFLGLREKRIAYNSQRTQLLILGRNINDTLESYLEHLLIPLFAAFALLSNRPTDTESVLNVWSSRQLNASQNRFAPFMHPGLYMFDSNKSLIAKTENPSKQVNISNALNYNITDSLYNFKFRGPILESDNLLWFYTVMPLSNITLVSAVFFKELCYDVSKLLLTNKIDGYIICHDKVPVLYDIVRDKLLNQIPCNDCVNISIKKTTTEWDLLLKPNTKWEIGDTVLYFVVGCVISAIVFVFGVFLIRYMHMHEQLLEAILPKHVIPILEQKKQFVESLDNVVIIFSDIVDYTKLASEVNASEIVKILNNMFSRFDDICDKHGVYKLETVGDAFVACVGCPKASGTMSENVKKALEFAYELINVTKMHCSPLQIRVGIHCGSIIAAVVGKKKPHYSLIGNTINVASRMQTTSEPMQIHLTEEVAAHANPNDLTAYDIDVKGKGKMHTYWYKKGLANIPFVIRLSKEYPTKDYPKTIQTPGSTKN